MPVIQSALPMTLKVSWNPQMELGMGYDYIAQSPLIPVISSKDVNHSPVTKEHLEYKYVTSQEDLSELIEASVQASGSIQGLEVKASLEFSKSVRFSDTSETLVFSWYSDCAHFDRIATPTLDATALALSTAKPDDFRLRYGDYFISGGLQRAEFHAVYQMSALKKDDLLKFKGSAAVSSPDVFSVSGSAAFTKAATENHVSISANVYQTDSKSSMSLGSTPSLTPTQVLQMFNQFQADHQDSWAVAELTHYNALAPNLTRVVAVPPSFFVDRALLLGARIAYWGFLNTPGILPRDTETSLKQRRTALDAKIDAESPLYWKKPDDLTRDRKAAEELAKDVRDATEFLHRVHILGGSDGGYSNLDKRRGGEAGIGTHGDQTSVPAGITVNVDTFDLKGDWKSGNITRHADKHYPGCTIIYFRAHNNWGADEGGTLSTSGEGGVGSDRAYFGCTADFDTGLSWSFTVKYIESAQ
ncbi:MAG: hypothetical protein EOQ56_14995 [Mesorhizobium sp.]|nr:MAG: hypothetical protein EOQ56_14995 [Mesorhizobium sp.]